MAPLDDIIEQQLSRNGELTLVTSVLGASASWYAHSFLSKAISAGDTVVHISFLHDATFHADCLRKHGVDLGLLRRKGKYLFIDCLTGLFAAAQKGGAQEFSGSSFCALSADIVMGIKKAVSLLPMGKKALVVVENMDFLLSAGGITSNALINELLDWHELVSSTMVMVNADSALVSRARTRLEMEEASFVTALAHQASRVVSLRMLDTGLAKDVSGVLRVTTVPNEGSQNLNEQEVLYFVKDGSVEVFTRGEMRSH